MFPYTAKASKGPDRLTLAPGLFAALSGPPAIPGRLYGCHKAYSEVVVVAVVVDVDALVPPPLDAIAAIAATAMTPAPIAARVPTERPAMALPPAEGPAGRGPVGVEAGIVVCAMAGAAIGLFASDFKDPQKP